MRKHRIRLLAFSLVVLAVLLQVPTHTIHSVAPAPVPIVDYSITVSLDQSIQADLAEARALGITGVPFFVLAGKYGISGAQPAEVFEGALNQVWEELNPAPALKPLIVPGVVAGEGGGEACGPEGCD